MPTVLVSRPTVTRNSLFVSLAPVTITVASAHFAYPRRMTGLSWPGWLGYIPRSIQYNIRLMKSWQNTTLKLRQWMLKN